MAGEYGRSDEGRNVFDSFGGTPGMQPPGRTGGGATVGGDLGEVAAGYGVSFGGGGGFQQESQEPPVWMGQKRQTGMARTRGTYTSRVVSLSEATGEFYSWSDAQLRKFQEQAYEAGLYGNVDRAEVPFGDFDEDTFSVWSTMVQRSAAFYSQGKKVSPMKALEMAGRSKPVGVIEEVDGPPPLVTVLSNPDELKKVMQAGARSVLGRKVSDADLEAFVSSIQGQEAAQQKSDYGMQVNEQGGTVTKLADPRVQAEVAAREIDPLKADSRKVVGKFDALVGMLGEGGLLQTQGAGQ